jgi:hypothetical protein
MRRASSSWSRLWSGLRAEASRAAGDIAGHCPPPAPAAPAPVRHRRRPQSRNPSARARSFVGARARALHPVPLPAVTAPRRPPRRRSPRPGRRSM